MVDESGGNSYESKPPNDQASNSKLQVTTPCNILYFPASNATFFYTFHPNHSQQHHSNNGKDLSRSQRVHTLMTTPIWHRDFSSPF
jgi:uncharacterized ParB-like nuclease family protein